MSFTFPDIFDDKIYKIEDFKIVRNMQSNSVFVTISSK